MGERSRKFFKTSKIELTSSMFVFIVPDTVKLSETVTAVESSDVIVLTCKVSLILIELESSALKVVPLILIAPIIILPVPDA